MISRTKHTKTRKPRSNFLNNAQRKALKESLLDRYKKDFGLKNPELVQEMVEDFFRGKNEVNSKTLAELERQIRRVIIKGSGVREGHAKRRRKEDQRRESQREEAKERGGHESHLEEVDPVDGLRNAILSKIDMERRARVVNGDLNLDYMDDMLEEEMGLMSKKSQRSKLKNYLEEQEKRIENQTKILGQKIVKEELDLQRKEKEELLARQREEEKNYERAIREKIRADELEKEAEEKEREIQKKKTRKVQDRIIRDRREQLQKEKEKSEQENQKLVEAIKADLEHQKQKEEQRFRVMGI
jgi:hypothetical protein